VVLPDSRTQEGMNQIILPLSTSCWLGVTALCDLRKRTVPNWLTLPVLGASLLWGFFRGEWAVSTFVLLLILASDLPFAWGAVGAASLVALFQLLPFAAFNADESLKSLALFWIWSLWKLGKMGGADAKVLLALTQTFGLGIFLTVLIAGGVFALFARIRRQFSLPYLVPVFFGSVCFFLGNLLNHP
jgi:Flp pilus assembly protein protease CpaA